jgi:hypothetical protein
VSGRECGQLALAGGREGEADDAVVLTIGDAAHESGLAGAVDELDDAVVAQQEMVGDLADRRRATVPADGEKQLVLGGRQSRALRLSLAPAKELAETVAELEQPLELGVGELVSC